VTIFTLFDDPDHSVELIIDESPWEQEAFQFHPLVNTSTLLISKKNLKRFLAVAGHEVRKLAVPSQKS
jgi:Ala-tRNA(Pro) deacylase